MEARHLVYSLTKGRAKKLHAYQKHDLLIDMAFSMGDDPLELEYLAQHTADIFPGATVKKDDGFYYIETASAEYITEILDPTDTLHRDQTGAIDAVRLYPHVSGLEEYRIAYTLRDSGSDI